MFSGLAICVLNKSKSYERILGWVGWVGYVQRKKWLDFGDDPDFCVIQIIQDSFLYHGKIGRKLTICSVSQQHAMHSDLI